MTRRYRAGAFATLKIFPRPPYIDSGTLMAKNVGPRLPQAVHVRGRRFPESIAENTQK